MRHGLRLANSKAAVGERYATVEPRSSGTMLWGHDFGPRIGRGEDVARAKLAQDVEAVDPAHVFVSAPADEQGVFYLWCHVRPIAD